MDSSANAERQARVAQGPPFSATLDGWRVTAKKPEYINDDQIIGKFTFERESGDAETRGGGACLVADLDDNYRCETREDCLAIHTDEYLEELDNKGGYIYCQAMNGQKHNRCWTRPTVAGCTRSPGRVPGTYETTPTSALVDGQPVLWMTAACLAADGFNAGCGSSEPGSHVYATSPPLDTGEE